MVKFFQKIKTVLKNRTTYSVGLLQTKAYRILKQATTVSLKEFDISALEWALLGLLYITPMGMLQNEIAEELGVETSFITVLSKPMIKKGLIEKKNSRLDNRAKITCITSAGQNFVIKIEKYLLSETKYLIQDASTSDIAGYLTVLETIIKNSKKVT
jgi:DNA-binding MarR family transcriptional regulator